MGYFLKPQLVTLNLSGQGRKAEAGCVTTDPCRNPPFWVGLHFNTANILAPSNESVLLRSQRSGAVVSVLGS